MILDVSVFTLSDFMLFFVDNVIQYDIIEGNPKGNFAVNKQNGTIYAYGQLDYDTQQVVSFLQKYA